MTTDWYLDAIRGDGNALAAAAAAAGLGAAVPSCPGWTVADLVEHTGVVHRHKALIVRELASEEPPRPSGPPGGADLMRWYGEGLDELLAVLGATDQGTAMWSWYPADQTAGFWRRRMAHETAIHRVDAELAAGSARGVEARLAVDGIDEVLTAFMGDEPGSDQLGERAGTLHLHTTDAEGEWLASVHANALVVERRHAKADAALRGSASDLLLWLWGRGPLERLERFGDPSMVARVRALAAEATV